MLSLVTKSVLAFAMVAAALAGTGMSANAEATPSYVEEFINATGPAAHQIHQEYSIPASVIIAQAADESRYGRSILSKEDNNYFGIKCKSENNPGSSPATGCKMLVNLKGEDPAYYRVYKSEADSLRDYGQLLTKPGGPYVSALPYRDNAEQFIQHIGPIYSTNKNYANEITKIMKDNNLEVRFDPRHYINGPK